ncbi:hypothetical protein BOQ00_07595 [Campylobacter coli]|nr:hypothetical protein BOQ00_07595 [Campylobacter coli]
MSTDNLYKQKNTISRKKASNKQANEIVCIIYQGEKTEKNYLNRLRDFFKLSDVNTILSKNLSSLQVITFIKEKSKKCSYDNMYANFNKAKQKFHHVAMKFNAKTENPCKKLINQHLKKYIKDYKKNYNFTNIIHKLDTAISNATKANNHTNSYAFIDKLALKFQELNNKKITTL